MAAVPMRARWLLLAAAGLVVLVAAGYFVAGYYRQRAVRKDLPARLGLDIQQDSTGFTVSKSEGGHTIFTLHAARAVQFRAGGDARLRDVRITLYGPPGSQRQDRISGAEFAFNQQTGVATASGDVEIDLQGVTYSAAKAAAGDAAAADTERGTIHLRTRGLTFSQKTGIAETSQPTEFRLPQAEGSATGAAYDSAGGVLTLQSDVTLHTSVRGDVHTLTAAHAVLERATRQITLEHAQLQSTDKLLTAGHAVLLVEEDGTVRSAQASGGVRVQTDTGAQAEAPRGTAVLQDGALRSIHLEDGVQFHQRPGTTGDDAAPDHASPDQASSHHAPQHPGVQTAESSAQTADLLFTSGNALGMIHLRGNVRMNEAAPGVTRSLQAAAVDIAFNGRHPSGALATGAPVFDEQQSGPKGTESRTLRADTLSATLDERGQITALHGMQHAQVKTNTADGTVDQSWADDLRASFAGSGKDRALRSVQEQGHVRLEQTTPKANAPAMQTATAESANYDAAADSAVLTGSPRWSDGSMALSADRVTLHRADGTALAEGNVKGTYANASNTTAEASHVIAQSALFHSADHTALFRGNVRLWQGNSSVTAPSIRMAGVTHEMTAEAGPESSSPVRAVFVSQPAGARPARPSALPAAAGSDTVLITGRKLMYSDSSRTGHFSGGVTLRTRDATVRSETLDAYLAQNSSAGAQPARMKPAQGTAAGAPIALAGRLERAVARGQVMLQQPGRSGSGDELVYTAADGVCVLTGSAARPPRLDDAVKGSVTGESLVFGSRDDSVRVEGGHGRTASTTYTGKQ